MGKNRIYILLPLCVLEKIRYSSSLASIIFFIEPNLINCSAKLSYGKVEEYRVIGSTILETVKHAITETIFLILRILKISV
jgi:hypothetical protein